MRSTVLMLSLAAAFCGGLGAVRAGDLERIQYVPDTDGEGSADEPGIVALSDDELPWYEEILTPPHWFDAPAYGAYAQADALWLMRSHNVERPLVVQIPNTNVPVLSAQDASLIGKFDLGTLFTLGYQLDKVAAVELTFFWFNNWSSSASVFDPTNNLHLAGTLSPFTNDFAFADQMTITYSSRLFNAEANYKQTIEGLTLLAGFRWFNLTEQFNINAHNPTFGESSDYHVTAYNYLVGLQTGAGYSVQWGRLNLGILGKIGVFANIASQRTLLQDFGNTQVDRDYRTGSTPVSVLGEIAANATFQITDWMALRAGYRFIGVNNLALGPSQLDLRGPAVGSPAFINVHDYLLLQGVNAGVEFRW
jgi:hypothetical protein